MAEWEAFYRLEPFGPHAEDVRLAQLTALTANVHRGKDGRRVGIADVMLGEQAPAAPAPDLDAKILRAFGVTPSQQHGASDGE